MDDITKGLQSAITVVDQYQRWRKGEDSDLFRKYTPQEITIALEVVTEAAKVLLTMEKIKNQQAQKND
jgi:hypothetical protein